MQDISSMTQKGQVTIPKAIRDKLSLKTADRLAFSVHNDEIVARPVPSIDTLYGIFHRPGQKPLTKKQMKKIIEDGVVEKFKRKRAQGRA